MSNLVSADLCKTVFIPRNSLSKEGYLNILTVGWMNEWYWIYG